MSPASKKKSYIIKQLSFTFPRRLCYNRPRSGNFTTQGQALCGKEAGRSMKRKSSEPTISQVAAMAGVSIATVSRVLNDPSKVRPTTVEKVSAAIDTLAYPRPQPATDLRNRLIVVVLPNLDNPFYSKIIKGIQVSAKGHGLEVLLYAEGNVDAHSRRLLDMLAMIQARGLILLSPVNRLDVLNELAGALPLVQCAEYNEESALPYVGVDDFAAARNATETLIRRGRRRIALINGPDRYKYARHRYLGYADALRHAGLTVDGALVANVTEMGFDSSLAVARQMLLASERPDAILAASDMYAAAVVKAATSEGIRIPDDLALIGFDNTYISQMSHPSVAAVSLPRFQLGYMACEVLSERIMNPASDEPRHFLLETELVLRDSV